MGLIPDYEDEQTPLEPDEMEGLLIKTISTRGELDEFEQLGVANAVKWVRLSNFNTYEILSVEFIQKLHRVMFKDVWRWAGEFRTTNKNIGVDKYQIRLELKNLLENCNFWIEKQSFRYDEIAIRLSHRLVVIHPFSNGNGRHSRLMADILISKYFNQPMFTWGSRSLVKKGEARSAYLTALKEADGMNYQPLMDFARS
ncbi:MAG: mobile mystery protein B [Bacteroidetes bacterium]|nr:mobile mystery protein B [Bacteroidota bacterium]